MNLSAVVLTKNEEKNIAKCLNSLKFCDEIILIDDYSTDKTANIARNFGAKIFNRHMNMNFADQSNFGIKKAKGEWSLLVDADEIITPELAREIQRAITPNVIPGSDQESIQINAYQIPRIDYFLGKKLRYGEPGKSRVTRLVKKGKGQWSRRVHPTLNIKGEISTLKNPIMHYPHENIAEFIRSINRWSFWHSLALDEENKKSSIIKITLWPILKFIQNYILRLGFLDGTHGFVHAVIMSFHSFLGWSNLYVKTHK